MESLDSLSNFNFPLDQKSDSGQMSSGIRQKRLLQMPLTSLEDLGPSIQAMELSMAPRSTLKFMMLYVVNISVVLSNVISNFQSDLIFNIKLRVQLKSKHTLQNTKQLFQSKPFSIKFSKQTTWTIKISLGTSTV